MSEDTDRLVWPWTMEKFKGTKGDKRVVLEELNKRNMPIEALKEKPPHKRILKVATKILIQMLDKAKEGKTPWLIVLSNSISLLQSIALLCPISYSLTTLNSCAMTSTTQLLDLFYGRSSSDLEFSEESIQEYRLAGFLSWEGVNGLVAGSQRQAGRFSSLLEYRMRHRLLTLFTAPYGTWSSQTPKQELEHVEQALGGAAKSMIHQGMIINLKTDLPASECVTIQV